MKKHRYRETTWSRMKTTLKQKKLTSLSLKWDELLKFFYSHLSLSCSNSGSDSSIGGGSGGGGGGGVKVVFVAVARAAATTRVAAAVRDCSSYVFVHTVIAVATVIVVVQWYIFSAHKIEGSRPEWCISCMIYGRDTSFWSGTFEIQVSFLFASQGCNVDLFCS